MSSTRKYLYYIAKSPKFNAEKARYHLLLKDRRKGPNRLAEAKAIINEQIEWYEIPPKAQPDFISLLVAEDNPFDRVSIHEVGEDHEWSLKMKGPCVAIVINKYTSERQFHKIWKQFNTVQNGLLGNRPNALPKQMFDMKEVLREKSDFDEVFEWYKLRNGKDIKGKLRPYSEIQRMKNLPATKDRKYIESRVNPIKKLMQAVQSENK